MGDRDERGSSSGTLTIVLVVVVLLLALPCLAVVGVVAMRLVWVARPDMQPPPIVQPVEPIEPMVPTPVEPPATAPKEET